MLSSAYPRFNTPSSLPPWPQDSLALMRKSLGHYFFFFLRKSPKYVFQMPLWQAFLSTGSAILVAPTRKFVSFYLYKTGNLLKWKWTCSHKKNRLTWVTYLYYLQSHLLEGIWAFKRKKAHNGNPSELVQHKRKSILSLCAMKPRAQGDLFQLSINWWKSGRNICNCRNCLLRRWLICIGTLIKHFVNDIN